VSNTASTKSNHFSQTQHASLVMTVDGHVVGQQCYWSWMGTHSNNASPQ